MTLQYAPSFLEGIDHFNCARFFEAHEAWEDVWMPCRDSSRASTKSLIQIAVCLHHFGRGNTRGARKLFFSSQRYLAQYGHWHMGIDLQRLLDDFRRCLAEVADSDAVTPPATLDRELLPRIHFCETGDA